MPKPTLLAPSMFGPHPSTSNCPWSWDTPSEGEDRIRPQSALPTNPYQVMEITPLSITHGLGGLGYPMTD
ncbi:unnamed protein product [Aspergillus oryzae]|uniref:Unnamed protein product n=2 Tax=Aspergillus oryzae TaxID=5062 RepID=A0AAN4YE57_ASPOZ|nr:unnamed protein product [Aspergillus oryzae]GMF87016.1 unnamed protein product [Aspergillus oryzae]GMG13368.1 unnamed protein product [Aspergillus oryzae]GMG25355.1 unnamed protein product [Aspergillus oryzae]GMG45646.1 unnamed protein product [Aspergillus oryzae var. brunneus]